MPADPVPTDPVPTREIGERKRALNVRELLMELNHLPEKCLDYPVHLMDMDPAGDYPEGGLLNAIETDCFDEDQGMVLSLIAGDKVTWLQCHELAETEFQAEDGGRLCCQRTRGHEGPHTLDKENPGVR